jgi:hypothetical protein
MLGDLQLILMFTSVRRWRGFKSLYRFTGKSCKKPKNSICFFYSCHGVLADLTPGGPGLGNNAVSFLCFICLCAFACNIVELMGDRALELIY